MTTPEPQPVMKGVFSLYQTPDGGYHLAYRPEGHDQDLHMAIPGAAVRMAQAMADGKVPGLGMLSKMMGGGK